MISQRIVSSRRRRIITAAVLLSVNPQSGFAQFSSSVYGLYPQLSLLIRTALAHLKGRRLFSAVRLLEQANEIVEALPEERWPWRCYVLPPYGFALLELGRNQEAEEVLQRALQAHDRIVSENLPRFKEVVASLDEGMGKELIKVEFMRQLLSVVSSESQQIQSVQDLLSDQGVGTADLLFTLARAFHATGKNSELVALYEKYIATSTSDPANIVVVVSQEYRLLKVAALLFQGGEYAKAGEALDGALKMNARRFQEVAKMGASMETIWAAFAVRRGIISSRLSLCNVTESFEAKAESLLAQIIESKGGGVRFSESLKKQLDSSSNPAVRLLRDQAYELDDRMAALPSKVDGIKSFMILAAQHGIYLMQAIRTMNALDSLNPIGTSPFSLIKLRNNLGDSAVVGFILYSPLSATSFKPGLNRYIRYCLTKEEIQFIDVGDQASIELDVYSFRRDILSGGSGRKAGLALVQKLLKDLPPTVNSASEWIVDPDGALGLLPFEALPTPQGTPLLVKHSFRYVTSLNQLLRTGRTVTAQAVAQIVANPLYSTGFQEKQAGDEVKNLRLSAPSMKSRSFQISSLPETEIEAKAVCDALAKMGIRTQLFQGADATVAALHSSPSPLVLHVAAHAALLESEAERVTGSGDGATEAIDLVLPGRRSALVLSRDGQPDFILAKDIARLPLEGTALVVLSACNTGNGDLIAGEGIASLRRAVELAGASSSITSIWPVPSKATVELMQTFYGLLKPGKTVGEALQQAKLELYKQGHAPFEWAGFLFAGSNVSFTTAPT